MQICMISLQVPHGGIDYMSAKFWNDEDSIPICIVPASAGYEDEDEDEDDDTDGWFSVVQGVIVEYWRGMTRGFRWQPCC
jgi:hypothetical protein